MRRNRNTAPLTETRTQRRDCAVVQVRLDETLPEVRARIEADWNRREAKAAELRAIRNSTGPRNDAYAVKSEGEALSGGQMSRGKDTAVSDVQPGKTKRSLGGDVVVPEEPDATVSDGTTEPDGVNPIGTFKRGKLKRESAFGV